MLMAKLLKRAHSNTGATVSVFDVNAFVTENVNPEKSPLHAFVRAKTKIKLICDDFVEYVNETEGFINELSAESQIVKDGERELTVGLPCKVAALREELDRVHMKVAFLGSTSNGKTSVINAMLHKSVLPVGDDNTTNCFCQVEGSYEPEAYIMIEGNNEKFTLENIKQHPNGLCQHELNKKDLVRVFWPRNSCRLLSGDIVFMDSPALDATENVEKHIEKYCLNADTLVMVLNSENDMTTAEKQFLHTISQTLSEPNIIILNNRSDVIKCEPSLQKSVRSQQSMRCSDFLTKDLRVCNRKEASERIFFVSARETLQARLEQENGNPPYWAALAEGFRKRYFEFQDFERKLEECISMNAISRKLKPHIANGESLATDMHTMLDEIYERAAFLCKSKEQEKMLLVDRILGLKAHMMKITSETKKKIQILTEETRQKVSNALTEEICELETLIDRFKMPFHTDPVILNIYKKQLNSHVGTALRCKLRAKFSMALSKNVEAAKKEMTVRMHALLPTGKLPAQNEYGNQSSQLFEMYYPLNCQNICADFQENLAFKFSWGVPVAIQRFAGKVKECYTDELINEQNDDVSNSFQSRRRKAAPSCPFPMPVCALLQEQLAAISTFLTTAIGSEVVAQGLTVAEAIPKTGWRVFMGINAFCGCFYLYKRMSWNKSAKQQLFKEQYLCHASKKLKLVLDMTCTNCSHQVEQELSCCFARLCGPVDEVLADMNKQRESLETQLSVLDGQLKGLKSLRNKACYLLNEIEIFENAWINRGFGYME